MRFPAFLHNLWSQQPVSTPELSCFVKGLIRSMETEPAKWHTNAWVYNGWEHQDDPKLVVWYRSWCEPAVPAEGGVCFTAPIPPEQLTPAERLALGAAIKRYLVLPLEAKRAAEARASEDARRAALQSTIDRFAKLGCPDS